MILLEEVTSLVAEILQIGSRLEGKGADTALIGEIPEFDSMAVVSI